MKLSPSDVKWLRTASKKLAAMARIGGPVRTVEAVSKDTEDFTEWALNKLEPMDVSTVRQFVEKKLHIDTKPPTESRGGPRFIPGDLVIIKKDKHLDHETLGPYSLWTGKIGVVDSTDGLDVMVTFKEMPTPVRFPNGLKARGVGIYKYTPPYTIEGSAAMEMIYLADPTATTSADQKITVEIYLSRGGPKETRSANYYSGHVNSANMSKEGGWYFQAIPQQRVEVGSEEEKFQFRRFNPAKGKVLYIGLQGKRPQGWKEELKKLRDSKASDGKTAKEKYPWDECISDQMKQYGDKEIAEKVCGKIKAESQGLGKSKK